MSVWRESVASWLCALVLGVQWTPPEPGRCRCCRCCCRPFLLDRLFVCLFACLFVCLFVCLFACLFVFLFVCLFACLFVCLLVCSFVCLFVRSFVRWIFFYQILSFSEKGRVSIRPLEVCKRRASGEEFAATWVDTRFGAPLRMTFVVGSTPPLRMPVENQGL